MLSEETLENQEANRNHPHLLSLCHLRCSDPHPGVLLEERALSGLRLVALGPSPSNTAERKEDTQRRQSVPGTRSRAQSTPQQLWLGSVGSGQVAWPEGIVRGSVPWLLRTVALAGSMTMKRGEALNRVRFWALRFQRPRVWNIPMTSSHIYTCAPFLLTANISINSHSSFSC